MWVWGEDGLDTQVLRVDRSYRRSNPIRYPARELLGFSDDDRAWIAQKIQDFTHHFLYKSHMFTYHLDQPLIRDTIVF